MPDGNSRVTFNIPTEEIDALKALADSRKTTVTHAIRRAIALELFLSESEAKGGKLLIEEKDGSFSKLVRRSRPPRKPSVARVSRYKRRWVI